MTLIPQDKSYNMRVYLRQPVGRLIRMGEPMSAAEVNQLTAGLGNMVQGHITGATKDGRSVVIPIANVSYIEFIER